MVMAEILLLRIPSSFALSVLLHISVLGALSHYQNPLATPPNNKISTQFDFDSSSPHVFSSLRYLLRQWPNTFFPNGHSIVPCEISPFVQLYHGRTDDLLPASPEWLAFDIEMAYGIMGSTRTSRMLTYQTMGPVKCLYFDGLSAGLINMGQLDSQMLFLYGNSSGPPAVDEYRRAVDLCGWIHENGFGGSGWGVEGIVRMNAGFEMIWCNLSSPSIRLIDDVSTTAPPLWTKSANETVDITYRKDSSQRDNQMSIEYGFGFSPSPTRRQIATAPAFPSISPDQERVREQEPYFDYRAWGWFRSATRQYGRMEGDGGESRVRLFTCGFMTFYDPIFGSRGSANAHFQYPRLSSTSNTVSTTTTPMGHTAESLHPLSLRRRWQDLASLTQNDSEEMRAKTRRVLKDFVFGNNTAAKSRCTGAEWHLIADKIAQRFSRPLLDLIRQSSLWELSSYGNDPALMASLRCSRASLHSVFLPFFEYPETAFLGGSPGMFNRTTWSSNSELARSTFSRCQRHHTHFITSDGMNGSNLLSEEKLIIASFEDVMSTICRTLIPIFFSIERSWFTHLNTLTLDMEEFPSELRKHFTSEAKVWTHRLRRLYDWLGWEPDRITCNRPCGWDEVCYIPMWPLRLVRQNDTQYIVHDPSVEFQSEEELLNPRCVNINGYAKDESTEA